MPVTKFTKPVVRALGPQVEGLLQDFCRKNGLTATYEGGRFSEDEFTMKVTLRTATNDAMGTLTPAQFKRDAVLLGLPEDCLGKTTLVDGVGYKITGIHLNRPKYPVSVTQLSTGRRIKMQAASVLRGLLK